MGLLQTQLNRNLPFGRIFHGSGEPSKADTEVAFYQHGLYFKPDGSLATDSPYNKEKIAMIEALGRNTSEPEPVVQQPDRAPVNPQVVSELEAKNDEEVFDIATTLSEVLVKQGIKDDYEPSLQDRDGNVAYIAKYTS